jgi:hypothetical protein
VTVYSTVTDDFCVRLFLSRIFGPKRDEVTLDWRKLHIDECHNFCSSSYINTFVKAWRMRWMGHVARLGEMYAIFQYQNVKRETTWGDPCIRLRAV